MTGDGDTASLVERVGWFVIVGVLIAGSAAVVASAVTLAALARTAGWVGWTPWLLPAALDVGGAVGGWCWVRPGVFDAKASFFWLHSRLIALDLPAFERPAKATSGNLYFGKSCSRLTVVKKRACQSTDMGEAGGRNEAMNRQEICGISVMYQTSPRGHCSTMPGCISAQTNHKIRVPE